MGNRPLRDLTQKVVRWRTVHLRSVAEKLRSIASGLQYDFRCADQLRSLAAGFERFADRLERDAVADQS